MVTSGTQQSSTYVVGLESCTGDGVGARIGGKALGLGRLIAQHLPVPPGFVVTTDAYVECVATAGLGDRIIALLAGAGTPEGDARASEAIRALFAEQVMVDAVAAQIRQAYDRLGGRDDVPVAVRSSANAEDLPEASFAGQQDTYLWVTGADHVVAKVLSCWASLFTPQAIGYRARFDVPAEHVAMAVVVQQMVAAESAGVLMTLDPTNGDRSTVYIESAFGLGEAVVRGDVETDRIWVRKQPLEVVRSETGRKTRAWRFDPARGEVVLGDLPAGEQELPSLRPAEALALARLAVSVEESFGFPMDIEWAVGAEDPTGERPVHALQARPETVWSRRPEPTPAATSGEDWDTLHGTSAPGLHWTTSNLGEAMPGVLTPLSWSVWAPVVEHAPRQACWMIGALTKAESRVPPMEERFIRAFYGRPAMQVEFLADVGDRMPGTTGPASVASIFGHVPEDMTFHPTKRRYPAVAWRLPRAFAIAPGRARDHARATDDWWRSVLPGVGQLDLTAAVTLFREASGRLDEAVSVQTLLIFSTMQPMYEALTALVAKAGVGDVATLSGTGGAEMAVVGDIWRASRGEITVDEVTARHGFHGPLEGELSSRIWREDDTPLRKVVQGYAAQDDDVSPAVRDRARRAELAAMQQQVLAALPAPSRPVARRLLALAAKRLPMRGIPKRSFLQAFDVTRAAARRAGALLAERGVLADPEDVFYLTSEELIGGPTDVRDLVAKRRARRAEYQRMTPPCNWTGMPEPAAQITDGTPTSAGAVSGIGVSAGVVEGIARVVTDPGFADVEPHEILVAPTTDPSWSSIMFISLGLVVDIGGALSHAAVVARELGIPCVVSTGDGTSVLRTGDRIRVDGTAGTVEILARA